MNKEVVVISLGGSVIVPDKIDTDFLKGFKKLIISSLKKYKFIIITGGGKTARNYINAAANITKVSNEDKDWLGIHSTRLNAHLVRTIFRDVANPAIVKDPTKKTAFSKVLVAAGWKPGCSTDYDAVLLAKTFKAKTVINITNIDYLYTKNPLEHKDAKIIKKTSWKGFRKIVGNKWVPGMSAPFDPIAAKLAQKSGMKLILVGKKLDNFKNFLNGRKFKGSIVEN
jgi:uridylate kinase